MCGCGNNRCGNFGFGNFGFGNTGCFQPCTALLVILILSNQGLLDGGKESRNALTLLFLFWLCGCRGGFNNNFLPQNSCCCDNRSGSSCGCNCGCCCKCKCKCKCKEEKCKCRNIKVCCS